MTQEQQPDALRLAAWLEQDWDGIGIPELLDVATELRRLQAQVQELQEERSARMRQSERLSARIAELAARKPLPLSEAAANQLWADCLKKHKRPGPYELIQAFCARTQEA